VLDVPAMNFGRQGADREGRKMRYLVAALACAGLVGFVPVAHADPDGDGPDTPSTTDEICGAFNMGVPPGDIPGRLGQNDGRWNYWRAQQRTSQTIIGGDCG
jgi:hypothetical protein